MTSTFRTGLKPLGVVVNAVLTFLILAVATRQGQFADIAAYSAGASFGALIAAVAGSGTSLAYVTGDASAQAAVRWVRHRFVAPLMTVGTVIAAVFYELSTDLTLTAVLLGGLSVVCNNMSELESAALERHLETPRMLLATTVSRSLGVAAIFIGASFGGAMLAASVINLAMLWFLSRKFVIKMKDHAGVRSWLRLAYAPSLMTLSVLGVFVTRSVLVVAPLLIDADAAGALASLISAQQSVTAITISALYTLMAVRVEQGRMAPWMSRAARWSVWLAILIGLCAAIATPIVIAVLSLSGTPDAALWWIMLACAIPFYTQNRRRQYELLGSGERTQATLLLAVLSSATIAACAVAMVLGHPMILAAAFLFAEATGFAVSTAKQFLQRDGSVLPGD